VPPRSVHRLGRALVGALNAIAAAGGASRADSCATGIDAGLRLDLTTTAVESPLWDLPGKKSGKVEWIFNDFVDQSQPDGRVKQSRFPAIVGDRVSGAG